jgi:hypothetical protein
MKSEIPAPCNCDRRYRPRTVKNTCGGPEEHHMYVYCSVCGDEGPHIKRHPEGAAYPMTWNECRQAAVDAWNDTHRFWRK